MEPSNEELAFIMSVNEDTEKKTTGKRGESNRQPFIQQSESEKIITEEPSNDALAFIMSFDENKEKKTTGKRDKANRQPLIQETSAIGSPNSKIKSVDRATMSLHEYRDHVVSCSVQFSVDNIKLYVRKYDARNIEHKVHLDCPCCDHDSISLEPYTLMGEHLKWKHEVTHISCPGSECGNNKEIPVFKFKAHLEKYHLDVPCPKCKKVTSALQVMEHMAIYHSKNPQDSQIKPSTTVAIAKKHMESKDPKKIFTYEILLNGQLLIVDSIHFYVISGVAFVDCPICVNKSLALHLLPDHIKDHHRVERITCPASQNTCGQIISWHKILGHIISHHGRLPCMFCDKVYKVNEMHHHMTQICEMSYYHQVSNANADTVPILPPVQTPSITLDNGGSNSTIYKSWTEMTVTRRREARSNAGKNRCPICTALVHSVSKHIRKIHIGENGEIRNTVPKPPKPVINTTTAFVDDEDLIEIEDDLFTESDELMNFE